MKKVKRMLAHFRSQYGEAETQAYVTLWEDGSMTMSWQSYRNSLKWYYDHGHEMVCREGGVLVCNYDGSAFAVSISHRDF